MQEHAFNLIKSPETTKSRKEARRSGFSSILRSSVTHILGDSRNFLHICVLFHHCHSLLAFALFNLLFFFRSFFFCFLVFVGSRPYLSKTPAFVASYSIIAHVFVCLSFFSDSSVRIHFGLSRCEEAAGWFRLLSSRCPAAVPGSFMPLKCHRAFQS